jgi:urea-proton symporter
MDTLTCGANLFGLSQYDNRCDFFSDRTALPASVGWLIVVGLGSVFSISTSVLVWLDHRFAGTRQTSENFSTAGRSIKASMTACDIVSKWTWAATLLQSSNVAFKYGVSGPFWYASGKPPPRPQLMPRLTRVPASPPWCMHAHSSHARSRRAFYIRL